MPPSGIGVPVAATPGLVPHDEVLVVDAPVLGLALVVAGALLEAAEVGVEVELLLLLLHPAITPPIAMAATAAAASRGCRRECLFMSSAFSWLTANLIPNGPGRCVASGSARCPEARRRARRSQVNGASLHCLWISCDVVYLLEAIECFAEIIAKLPVR
jgi:hypothetical protein